MEMNLFSSFDSYSGSILPLNLLILSFSFLFPSVYWFLFPRSMFMYLNMMLYLNKEFILLVGKKLFGGFLLYVSLFIFILQFNLLGMFPYVFAMTSQLSLNLYFSFLFFFIFYLLGWFKLPETMFSHLTPLGSPMILSPFLVIIEMISTIIRPFTLSIRLTANIVSGHILMEIILSPSENFSLFSLLYFMIVMPVLFLELMVCFVQAFVLSSLSGLYLGEPISH